MNKIQFSLIVFLLFLLSFSFLFAQSESKPKDDPLCGPKSLLVVCQKLGVKTNLEELKRLSDYEEGIGTTMAGLYKTVKAKGLQAVGMKISLDDLAKLKIPIIVYFWGDHFQAIDKFEKDKIRIIGPSEEAGWTSKEDFAGGYSGFALLISKNKSSFPKFKTNGSDIRFDKYVYNFGVVEQWGKRKGDFIFKFRNAGNEELMISRVSSSCSCTAILLSEKNIAPGGEGEIKATVDISGRKGEQDNGVYVYSNDSVTPTVILQVKGIIQRGLQVSPPNIHLGDVKKGTIVTRKVNIIKPEDEKLDILKTESSSKSISTKVSPIKENDYEGFEIEVALSPDIPFGKFEEKLTVSTTSEKSPIIEIPITANIKSDIELRPAIFFLGSVKQAETPTAKVTIFTTSNKPLKIERIENPLEKFVSVTVTPKTEGKEYEITATLKDNAPTGTIKGNITIYTNNPDQPKIEIPVYALIRE